MARAEEESTMAQATDHKRCPKRVAGMVSTFAKVRLCCASAHSSHAAGLFFCAHGYLPCHVAGEAEVTGTNDRDLVVGEISRCDDIFLPGAISIARTLKLIAKLIPPVMLSRLSFLAYFQ